MQKVFAPDLLLPNFDGQTPELLAPLAYDSHRAMASFGRDLHTLTSMSLKTLAARIEDEDRATEAADLVAKQQSRNLLRLYFEDHGLLDQSIEDGLDALKDLNPWRLESAHKIVPAEQDKDYRAIQVDLVDRVQRGLKAMLGAFVTAENASMDRYRQYVLGLNVD